MNKKLIGIITILIIFTVGIAVSNNSYYKKSIKTKNQVEEEIIKMSDPNNFFAKNECDKQSTSVVSGKVINIKGDQIKLQTGNNQEFVILIKPNTYFVNLITNKDNKILDYKENNFKDLHNNDSVSIITYPDLNKNFIGMVVKILNY